MTGRRFGHEIGATCTICEATFWTPITIDAENGPTADELDGLPDVCPACDRAITADEHARIQSIVDRETAGEISHEQAMEKIFDLAATDDERAEIAAADAAERGEAL